MRTAEAKPDTCVVGRGIPAWHRIGDVVPGLMTAKEAFTLGGQDWEVRLVDSAVVVDGVTYINKDKYSIVRMDTMAVLGDGLTKSYKLFQNITLYDLLEAVTGGEGEAHVITAGTLGGGRKVWAQCVLEGKDITIAGDKIAPYFFIMNGHDGKTSVTGATCATRIVCQNTLNMALREGQRQFHIRHVGENVNLESMKTAASETLQLVRKYYDTFETFAGDLLKVKVSKTQIDQLVELLIPEKEDMSKKGSTMLENARAALWTELDAPDLANVKGTAWGVYNGVAGYSDFGRGIKKAEKDLRGANERFALRSLEDNDLKDLAQKFLMALV